MVRVIPGITKLGVIYNERVLLCIVLLYLLHQSSKRLKFGDKTLQSTLFNNIIVVKLSCSSLNTYLSQIFVSFNGIYLILKFLMSMFLIKKSLLFFLFNYNLFREFRKTLQDY